MLIRFILTISIFMLSLSCDTTRNKLKVDGDSTRSITVYIECQKDDTSCFELKSINGELKSLDRSSKTILSVSKTALKKFGSGNYLIAITLTKDGTSKIEEITKANTGKKIAIVSNNKVLMSPRIHSPILGSDVQITLGQETSKSDALSACRTIDSKCSLLAQKSSLKKSSSEKNFLNTILDVDLKNISKTHSTVMESIAWHTEKTKLVVFKTNDLTSSSVYDLAIISNGKHKGKPIFYGTQEFDDAKGKFIYKNGAVKISSYGWIKREDLIPANLLIKENKHRKTLLGNYISIKCPKAVRKQIKNKTDRNNFDAMMKNISKVTRSSEVGLCALVGKTKCEDYIKKTKEEIDKRICKEMKAL